MHISREMKDLIKRFLCSSIINDIRSKLALRNRLHVKRGNKLFHKGALLQNVKICTRIGGGNSIVIAPGAKLKNCRFDMFGYEGVIKIGRGCICENMQFWMEDKGSSIYIGDDSTFCEAHLAAIEGCSIKIGKDCMFSSNIVFQNGDAHSVVDEVGNRTNPSKSIILGNHVWVGHSVLCEKGTRVADNSIIAAGAIVNKEFSKMGVVLAGVPAKIVKENVNWKRERI